jgi:hypothetical protein
VESALRVRGKSESVAATDAIRALDGRVSDWMNDEPTSFAPPPRAGAAEAPRA